MTMLLFQNCVGKHRESRALACQKLELRRGETRKQDFSAGKLWESKHKNRSFL